MDGLIKEVHENTIKMDDLGVPPLMETPECQREPDF